MSHNGSHNGPGGRRNAPHPVYRSDRADVIWRRQRRLKQEIEAIIRAEHALEKLDGLHGWTPRAAARIFGLIERTLRHGHVPRR